MITSEFLTAGKAIFTVSNPGGDRWTFKVTKKESTNPRYPDPTYFVAFLSGSDNTSSYSYLGLLVEGGLKLTAKSAAGADSQVAKVASWALKIVTGGLALPEGYSILNAGFCGRCARLLTVPESIESGIGPECAAKMAA